MARKEQDKSAGKSAPKKGTAPKREKPKGKAAKDPRDAVIDAAMALAAKERWSEISLHDIAKKSGVSLADLVERFPTKLNIVTAFMRRIDRAVIDALDPELAGEPARERLLDLLISRFEALAPYKDAVRSIARAIVREPDQAMILNRAAVRSQRTTMAAAGLDVEGLTGGLRAQGLAIIFARAMRIWLDDDDPGMARTMADLDRRLRDGERMLRACGSAATVGRLARSFFGAVAERRRRRPEPYESAD